MRYTWTSATHVGRVRSGNEDAVRPEVDGSSTAPIVIAVADGMGGAVAGEVASRIAVDHATAAAPDADIDPEERVRAANEAVIEATRQDPSLTGMGTTLTLAHFTADGIARIAHVGDSRLYVLRDGYMTQITTDHTLVNEMITLGQITPIQAETHPKRHLLTRVIGMPYVEIDRIDYPLELGDRVLLCSDGLTTMLRDHEIAEILHTTASPTEAAWSLVEAANDAGGLDNTTVAVVDVSP